MIKEESREKIRAARLRAEHALNELCRTVENEIGPIDNIGISFLDVQAIDSLYPRKILDRIFIQVNAADL